MMKHSCPKLGWWFFFFTLHYTDEKLISNTATAQGLFFRQCLQVCFSVSLAARVRISQSRVILTISNVTRQRLFVAVLTIICSHCLLRLWTTASSCLRGLLIPLLSFKHLRLDCALDSRGSTVWTLTHTHTHRQTLLVLCFSCLLSLLPLL